MISFNFSFCEKLRFFLLLQLCGWNAWKYTLTEVTDKRVCYVENFAEDDTVMYRDYIGNV